MVCKPHARSLSVMTFDPFVQFQMAASDADIEAVCSVISGNLREGSMVNTSTTDIDGKADILIQPREMWTPCYAINVIMHALS